MAANHEQSSRKLVYLRDHTPRKRLRGGRVTRQSPTPPPADLVAEGTWLGRALLVVTAGLSVYWLAVLVGVTRPETDEAWRHAFSHGLPHLFLAASAALSAHALLRTTSHPSLPFGMTAGAMIVLALEGITRAMTAGDLGDLSLNVRTNVLIQTAALAIGIWAASFALRSQRRTDAS